MFHCVFKLCLKFMVPYGFLYLLVNITCFLTMVDYGYPELARRIWIIIYICFMMQTTDFCSEESRRIQCTKCGNSHIWVCTNRTKAKARWCQVWLNPKLNRVLFVFLMSVPIVYGFWEQDCCQYHQAKDGDGWVENRGSLVFDRLQKV